MKALQVLLVVLLGAPAASGQSFHLGSCPSPPVQNNFNISKYMGTWYEIEKLPAVFEKGKCHQATYTLLHDGTVSVHNSELLTNGQVNSIEGVAKVKDPSKSAVLAVSFFKGVPGDPYWILSTDYRTHALVYSCSEYLGLFHIDFAWILARTRTLTDDVIRQQHDRLAAAGIDISRLIVSNQTGCGALGSGKG